MNVPLPPTPRLRSVGNAASLLQLMPQRISEIAELLDIAPAWYVNGVPHFNEADLERIATYAAAQRRAAGR
ncbi:hypothetical protein [Botrimarina sp.]|uniref:hypothetical protein n=1 Tax=Botrimarina sp. TaxID=2795802 RepID=UPI0032EAD813